MIVFRAFGVDVSDLVLSVTVPFCVYWLVAAAFDVVSRLKIPWVEQFRIHPKASEKQYNLHLLQMVIGLLTLEEPEGDTQRTLGSELVRFVGAMIVLDTWQFCFHKLMHEVDWLYKHVHVWHHKMYIPFSYGALYQHPLEMLIMDTLSGLVAVSVTAMAFWSLSYAKTVSDHSNYRFPVNPTNLPGFNNAEYHDVHHSPTGLRHNFAQPWFTFWDQVYGSYKDPLDGTALPAKKLS